MNKRQSKRCRNRAVYSFSTARDSWRRCHLIAISFDHPTNTLREMTEARTPGANSDQFDALVELLATDDACDDSNFHIAPEGTASIELRDASGKLDYAKIRSLFLQRRTGNDGNHVVRSDSLYLEPDSESGLRPPQACRDLIPIEQTVYSGYLRSCWRNRRLWQESLYFQGPCHSKETSNLVKLKPSQRFTVLYLS